MSQNRSNVVEQFVVGIERWELWKFIDHVLWRVEEEPVFGDGQHGRVVVGITRCDHAIVEATQGLDGFAFLVVESQFEIDDAVVVNYQSVADQRGHSEMSHQRATELLERVGQDEDLGEFSQSTEEFGCSRKRRQTGDHAFDFRHGQAVGVEDLESTAHQLVVVGFVAGGPAQLWYAGLFGNCYPNFGNEHPFEIQRDDGL